MLVWLVNTDVWQKIVFWKFIKIVDVNRQLWKDVNGRTAMKGRKQTTMKGRKQTDGHEKT